MPVKRNAQANRGSATFRPRARLMKIIGAELISDDVLAVTELVKNAHDADASQVDIDFREVVEGAGEIVVRDNGHGMDLDALLGHWMQPASRHKVEESRRSPTGRRMLGEKGVGRFAVDKLGAHLEVISRVPGARQELRAVFDWDDFDTDAKLLSDVRCQWELRSPELIEKHGTVMRISRLRDGWTERRFRRLIMRLGRLQSPFGDRDPFAICVTSEEFPEYSGRLRSDILEKAPYRLRAVFDGQECIDVTHDGASNERHRWNGPGPLSCGPVTLHIHAYDLETEAVARIGPRMEVRAWLKEWSGVSVYKDGFRVWPYGEPHNDWLRLDQRRVNNPMVRLSNNQLVGFVEVSQEGNPDLTEQTNREGFINNRALEDLRRLVFFVLQLVESHRQNIRRPATTAVPKDRSTQVQEEANSALADLATELPPKQQSRLRGIAKRLAADTAKAQAAELALRAGYVELAAAGQAAQHVRSDTLPSIEALVSQIEETQQLLKSGEHTRAQNSLRDILEATRFVRESVTNLDPLHGAAGGRRRTCDLRVELERCKTLLRPSLEAYDVEFDVELPRSRMIRVEMRPQLFQLVVRVLAQNTFEWLSKSRKRSIRIAAKVGKLSCDLMYSDSGPGIPVALAERVFDPYFSGRSGGTGLGLTLARSLVEANAGTITVITDQRRNGANFMLTLPLKRSRATM